MAIRKATTASGRQMTYTAGRTMKQATPIWRGR